MRSGRARPGKRKLRQLMKDVFKARLSVRDDAACRGIVADPEEIHLA